MALLHIPLQLRTPRRNIMFHADISIATYLVLGKLSCTEMNLQTAISISEIMISESPSPPNTSLLELHKVFSSPLKIASIELLQAKLTHRKFPLLRWLSKGRKIYLIRATSTDGAKGIAIANERLAYLYPILQKLVIPYFIGKDARDLPSLIDGVYLFCSNYKLSGLALWCCVAWLELSLLDLLGKVSNQPVGELLGGTFAESIPVYISSTRRYTTPEEEVALLEKSLEKTGAKAVKFKIGGRMSQNADAAPGRTERLVSLARKTFGSDINIYVDANGSYDATAGIEVGKMLESYNISFFEEPCPFDDFEQTKCVADALSIPIVAGEQETSFARFQWMLKNQVVDIIQPDIIYNGGMIRTLRVAQEAKKLGIPVAIHNPRPEADIIYTLHLASCLDTDYLEYPANLQEKHNWLTPNPEAKNGLMTIPQKPGLGISIDSSLVRRAKRIREW